MYLLRIVFICCVYIMSMPQTLAHEIIKFEIESKFEIDAPKFFKINQLSDIEDFLLYELKDSNNKEYMRIYIGNHPKIPDDFKDEQEWKIKPNGFATYEQKPICENKICKGQVIMKLASNEWPMYAHFIYKDVPKAKMRCIKQIIYSLRTKKDN